jgi:hypothetical protein
MGIFDGDATKNNQQQSGFNGDGIQYNGDMGAQKWGLSPISGHFEYSDTMINRGILGCPIFKQRILVWFLVSTTE